MEKRCPKCGGSKFLVTAHVTQGWLVGAAGNYMSTTTACEEVTHQPDNDDIWACASCGYDAAGSEFEKQLV